jgi:uncharacterized protein YciI
MEQFIYIIHPSRPEMLTAGPTDDENQLIEEHFFYLQELTRQGVAQLVGRTLNTDASAFGSVIFQAQSHSEATLIMEGDPAVAGGVMTAELFPYKIVMQSLVKE